MSNYWLRFILESDGSFGRGDGAVGSVDRELQHDEYGCPSISGRTIKGMLREECVNLVFALDQMGKAEPWRPHALRLFGKGGSTGRERSVLYIGDATIPSDLRAAIAEDIRQKSLQPREVLEMFTAIRQQTAIDDETGAPLQETLRAVRVLLRQTPFYAQLALNSTEPHDLALLAATIKAWRRGGTGRNRGAGELHAQLLAATDQVFEDQTEISFKLFAEEIVAL